MAAAEGGRGKAPPPPRRRRIALAIVGVLVLVIVADQLGVRRLSGEDFPPHDPLGVALRGHVERLASPEWGGRKPGTPGNVAAARYLADALRAAGAEPLPSVGDYLLPLADRLGGTRTDLGHNVVGYLPAGNAPPAGERPGAIVLGAHFDHIGPTADGVLLGADDNASGVAVLLGTLQALVADPHPRTHPIVIVFFDTEELPYFGSPTQGSRSLMRAPPPELAPRPVAAVVLDLIGGVLWRHTSEAIFACGAEKTPGLAPIVDAVREDGLDVRRLGIHMVENIPGRRPSAFSDYDVFREMGVPFLFLSSGRTPRYHRPTDLAPTLHYDRMARTSRWIARLAGAVDAATLAPFDPAGEDLAGDLQTSLWFLDAAVTPWGSVPGTGPVTLARLLGDRSRLQAMSAPAHTFTPADVLDLERASFRVQCLIYAFPACFTL